MGNSKTEEVNLQVRCSNGAKFTVKTSLESTVEQFKALLVDKCDVPANQQRLIYKGRILKDDRTLQSCGLEAEHTIHLVRGSAPAASAAAAPPVNAANSNSTTSATPDGHSNQGGGTGGAGLGTSVLPGLGLSSLGVGGASDLYGVPEFEQVHQQLTENPSMMREFMNSPAVQNLFNDPELMHNLIMSNPQMRELVDRNPELAHILNDPSIIQQSLEAARNPELMREMMRNTDRAMSNIEASPEGFNMLRRMYENVQEPLLNATTMSGSTGNDSGPNPFAALLGNQSGTQPRGGSNSPRITSSETTTGSIAPNINPLPNPWSSSDGGNQTNTTSRPSSGSDARATALGGLSGLGTPPVDNMLNGMPDPALVSQLLQNPAVSQMFQGLLSDPQSMNQILNLNPQLHAMMDSNSQLREIMQNPEVLRQLASPESMQQMMAVQRMLSQLTERQSTQDTGQAGATGGLDFLMNMFGGLGAGSTTVQNTPDVPAEELYATQLAQLQEMGFFNTQENIRALSATSGNVHAAVERLLGNFGQ